MELESNTCRRRVTSTNVGVRNVMTADVSGWAHEPDLRKLSLTLLTAFVYRKFVHRNTWVMFVAEVAVWRYLVRKWAVAE